MTDEEKRIIANIADEIQDYASLCWRAGDMKECEKHDEWVKQLLNLIGEKNA